MTVTVTVKARAHGAVLTVDGEPMTLDANREHQFQVNADSPFKLEVTEPASATDNADLPLDPENVPGRAENDALLGNKSDAEAPTSDPAADVGTKSSRSFRG